MNYSSKKTFFLFSLWLRKFFNFTSNTPKSSPLGAAFNYCNFLENLFELCRISLRSFFGSFQTLSPDTIEKSFSPSHVKNSFFSFASFAKIFREKSFFDFFHGEVKIALRNRTNVECWMKWVCWMGKHKKKHNNFLLFFFSHSAIIMYVCRLYSTDPSSRL
jgi:hypothetical protein